MKHKYKYKDQNEQIKSAEKGNYRLLDSSIIGILRSFGEKIPTFSGNRFDEEVL